MGTNKQESRIYTKNDRAVTFIASQGSSLTPNDTTEFEPGSLYIGTGGDVVCVLADESSTITFSNVPDGSFLPILVKMVYDTNTTASDILILR